LRSPNSTIENTRRDSQSSYESTSTAKPKSDERRDVIREKLRKTGGFTDEMKILEQSMILSTAQLLLERCDYPRDSDVGVKLLFVYIGEPSAISSLLLKAVNKFPPHGFIHTAIAVGTTIIEWNNSSLVVPRGCYSGGAMLAFDLPSIKQADVPKAIENLGELMEHFNSTQYYNNINNNCQHFTYKCLDALGIKTEFTGVMKEYVESVAKNGSCKREIVLPQQLQDALGEDLLQRIGCKGGTLKFESHSQFDQACKDIMTATGSDFYEASLTRDDLRELRLLLKAFDRAFWLNDYKQGKHQNEQELNKDCPFHNPASTQTRWNPTRGVSVVSGSRQVIGGSAPEAVAPKRSDTSGEGCIIL
jgi:hypothetical protein